MALRIVPVGPSDSASIERFVDLPRRIYANDPRWIEPLRASVAADLAGKSAFRAYADLQAFLAMDGDEVVGRCAAIINPRLLLPDGAPLGQVGYFESIDDQAVANALFDAAFDWLRSHGIRAVSGPMNGGAHRAHRLMVEGFEQEPFLLEPRNPRYYPRLFAGAGFQAVHGWRSFDWERAQLEQFLGFVERGATRARRQKRFHVENPDRANAPALFARLHALLDATWSGHLGYASLDVAELAEGFAGLLALMSPPSLVLLVDAQTGADVGLGYRYPDFADEVRALRGDAAGWGSWLASGARARRDVLHTVAMRPEVRAIGATQLILAETRHSLAEGYDRWVVALVDEGLRIFERVSAPTRRYALYARPL